MRILILLFFRTNVKVSSETSKFLISLQATGSILTPAASKHSQPLGGLGPPHGFLSKIGLYSKDVQRPSEAVGNRKTYTLICCMTSVLAAAAGRLVDQAFSAICGD